MGAMLGQMHVAGQSFSQNMPNPRGAAWRAATLAKVLPYLNTEQAALLDSECAFHAQHNLLEPPQIGGTRVPDRSAVSFAHLPQGIIHADLFRDNVLLEKDRVGGLIDFYFACSDALLYDVAITLNDWCMLAEGKLDAERAQIFLRAYHVVRPLLDCEREAWPRMLRLAALRFWLSRLFDKLLPRDGELIHAHDPAHFERVLKNHIATPTAVWL